MKAEIVADYPLEIGENPIWHSDEKQIYWEDIATGRIFRFDPARGTHELFYEGNVVGGFTIQYDGSLLLFMERGRIALLRRGTLSTIIEEIPEEQNTRFNDVIADPEGRVFCGTLPTEGGSAKLYRLERDGSITKILSGIGLSNGMGFTPDLKRMYHTDSLNRTIFLYEYVRSSGTLENQKVFLRIPEGEGVPDGMTVDRDGYVWSARWDGGCILRYTPEGTEQLRMELGVKKVSSLTFGGEDYMDLYVTTAGGGKREKEGEGAGALFRVRTGFQGVPEFRSKITP